MRKYNRLKERYYETDFINDEDSKVFANGVPKDFPNDVPEGAYFAFLDCFCEGDESKWDFEDFFEHYEGYWESLENFMEYYFRTIDTSYNGWNEDDDKVFEEDDFYRCVDFVSLGNFAKKRYEEGIKDYLSWDDLPEDKEEAFYVKFLSNNVNVLYSSPYKWAIAYIKAIAKREYLCYRDVVRSIDDRRHILHWDWGEDIIKDTYLYSDGFFFSKSSIF